MRWFIGKAVREHFASTQSAKGVFLFLLVLSGVVISAQASLSYRIHAYDVMDNTSVDRNSIVLIGDSRVSIHEWWEVFGSNPDIVNRAVAGNHTSEIIEHLDPILAGHPKRIILMTGMPEKTSSSTPLSDSAVVSSAVSSVNQIVNKIQRGSPDTEICVVGATPVSRQDVQFPSPSAVVRYNNALDLFCRDRRIPFIDIYSPFASLTNQQEVRKDLSPDGVTINSSGVRLLGEILKPYADSSECVVSSSHHFFSISSAEGSRVDLFANLPLSPDDIVMFGDNTVGTVNWYELMNDSRFKNRGIGWDFAGVPISGGPDCECDLMRIIPFVFRDGTQSPSRIVVYTGAYEISHHLSLEEFESVYGAMAESLAKASVNSEIYLVSLLPHWTYIEPDIDVRSYNDIIKSVARRNGFKYIDIYRRFFDRGKVDRKYFFQGELMYSGYEIMCRELSGALGVKKSRQKDFRIHQVRNNELTGIGNMDEELIRGTISTGRFSLLRGVTVKLRGNASDVKSLHLYCNGKRLSRVLTQGGIVEYRLRTFRLFRRNIDFRICSDIAGNASEGHRVAAEVTSVQLGSGNREVSQTLFGDGREIILACTRIYSCGDYEAAAYSEPALYSHQNGILTIANERRNDNILDLPARNDIVVRQSTDNGRTWDQPVAVAVASDFRSGYRDPVIVTTRNGDLIVGYSGHDNRKHTNGGISSKVFLSRSNDGGLTWDSPQEISSLLYGGWAADPLCWNLSSAFFSPGKGLLTRNIRFHGRILLPVLVYAGQNNKGNEGRFRCYALYSDDDGRHWNVSDCAFENGGPYLNVVELSGSRILMVNSGANGFWHSVSDDGGQSWGPPVKYGMNTLSSAVDNDLVNVRDGVILATVPYSPDANDISIVRSFDSGESFEFLRRLTHAPSSNSSIAEMSDGTLGVCLEKSPDGDPEIWFYNFSYEWLDNVSPKTLK